MYFIRTKYFRVYIRGFYAYIEINIGKVGRDLAIFIYNKDSFIRVKKYKFY